MIASWLGKIAALIGGLIAFFSTQQAQAALQKSIIFIVVLGTLLTLFLAAMEVIKDIGRDALAMAYSEIPAGGVAGAAMEWVGCVTPSSMPQALGVVFAVLATVGIWRFFKWLAQMKLSG
ncbi:MAG: hypothetical protein ACSLE2_20015 [Lysobacterales bacterium]